MLIELLHVLQKCYWFIWRPTTRGVKAIIVNKENKILLVEHTYGGGWFLPGGGLKRKEDPTHGMIREIKEEVGIEVKGVKELFGIYQSDYEYKKDTIYVFVVAVSAFSFERHNIEIKNVTFFDPNFLPENTSPGTKRRVQEYINVKSKGTVW